MLQSGNRLKSVGGLQYAVKKKLGEGGQGEVYEASLGKDAYALKWFFPHMATAEQKTIIENLISRGEPSPAFLWPKDMIVQGDTFGYIMPLRPPQYKGIVDLMKRRAEPSFRTLCIAGVNLCMGYQRLHSMGYSYRDISFGNVFLDPDSGDVLICDNDNVAVDGMHDSRVCGTPRFMAPEIVREEARPSTDTDLYSLAVLLFYMFMLHHPLEGKLEASIKCLDAHAMRRLYGTHPVFIWDPADKTNRPVPGYQQNAQDYWAVYPAFLKNLFIKAFTEGLAHPKKRIVEKEWQDAFVSLLNSVVCCPGCGAEAFVDQEMRQMGAACTCWRCQTSIVPPPAMVIGRHTILLDGDAKVLGHHTRDDYDLATVIGAVSQHPTNPRRWGITNLSDDVWTFVKQDGSQAAVDKGRTAPINVGARIYFGPVIGRYTL